VWDWLATLLLSNRFGPTVLTAIGGVGLNLGPSRADTPEMLHRWRAAVGPHTQTVCRIIWRILAIATMATFGPVMIIPPWAALIG